MPQVKLFELAFCLSPFSYFLLISDLLSATLAAEAMSHFSSSLSRPPKFRITEGSGLTLGRLPQTSTFPVIAFSFVAIACVLLVVAGSLAPPAGESRGASRESTCVSLELLYFAPL